MMATSKRTQVGSPERAKTAQAVFEHMAQGKSALKSCEAVAVPFSSFMRWIDEDAELAEQYARAREALIELMAAQTLEIADAPVPSTESGATDSGAVQKQRLQIDTRKWLLSKLAPKKYGEKIELSGDKDNPLMIQQIKRIVVDK